jgi:hypothetical protein
MIDDGEGQDYQVIVSLFNQLYIAMYITQQDKGKYWAIKGGKVFSMICFFPAWEVAAGYSLRII